MPPRLEVVWTGPTSMISYRVVRTSIPARHRANLVKAEAFERMSGKGLGEKEKMRQEKQYFQLLWAAAGLRLTWPAGLNGGVGRGTAACSWHSLSRSATGPHQP